MKWLDTSTTQDTLSHAQAFWAKLGADLNGGQFWADRITRFRGQPIERLKLALENLPLPAAFREAAIAIRALVRARRRNNEDCTDELVLLYWVAAIDSFSVPYSEYLNQPGYNILESIPGSIIKSLPFEYSVLGYRQLKLLTKTDQKSFVAIWGEPSGHTTLHDLHSDLWRKFQAELGRKQKSNTLLALSDDGA